MDIKNDYMSLIENEESAALDLELSPSEKYALSFLEKHESERFHLEWTAWERYSKAKTKSYKANWRMTLAQQELEAARNSMICEYEELKAKLESRNAPNAWDSYMQLLKEKMQQLRSLNLEASYEYGEMERHYQLAQETEQEWVKSESSAHYTEGNEHRIRYDELSAQIKNICVELHRAKEKAKKRLPKDLRTGFLEAEQAYCQAKLKYKLAKEEFETTKEDFDYYKLKFELAESKHNDVCMKLNAFKDKLSEEKKAKEAPAATECEVQND